MAERELTYKEAAVLLNVGHERILQMVKAGKIRKVGYRTTPGSRRTEVLVAVDTSLFQVNEGSSVQQLALVVELLRATVDDLNRWIENAYEEIRAQEQRKAELQATLRAIQRRMASPGEDTA